MKMVKISYYIDGKLRSTVIRAKGKTSACHRFSGYRFKKAKSMGIIESVEVTDEMSAE